MLTLAISCLSTFNLLWFRDLTFLVPMQYCSLQYHTLLSPPDTSTTGHCFCFGSASSILLALSPLFFSCVLATYWPGGFIFQCYIFLPFLPVHGVLKASMLKWFAIPFSRDHILSEHFASFLHLIPSFPKALDFFFLVLFSCFLEHIFQ